MVYGLGGKGAAVLKQETGLSFRELPWGEKNRSVGRIFLEHALLVSDVMVAIELSCRQNGRVRLLSDLELLPSALGSKPQTFHWKVNVSKSVALGVIPDRVFGLEFQNQSGVLDRCFFFLEADRGTMPVKRRGLSQTSFYRKLLAYEATWEQSIHHSRFGFHRFRVLTITSSAERVKSLVSACSDLKRGHGLFLFADRRILEQPTEFFDQVWQTGKQNETSRLLD